MPSLEWATLRAVSASHDSQIKSTSMLHRLQQRNGLPALATHGLLTRAAEVSGGQFLLPDRGDYIGPYSSTRPQ